MIYIIKVSRTDGLCCLGARSQLCGRSKSPEPNSRDLASSVPAQKKRSEFSRIKVAEATEISRGLADQRGSPDPPPLWLNMALLAESSREISRHLCLAEKHLALSRGPLPKDEGGWMKDEAEPELPGSGVGCQVLGIEPDRRCRKLRCANPGAEVRAVTHDELVFEAVSYRRHTGATLPEIRGYVFGREPEPRAAADDREALSRLEASGRVTRVGRRWFLHPATHPQVRGRALAPELLPEDVWILVALLQPRTSGPAALVELIVIADGINKAVPTFDELYGALNRLAEARLIQVSDGRYEVTERATELMTRVQAVCPRGLYEQWEGLKRLIACPCCGVRLKAVRWRVPLTEAEYRQALKQYAELCTPGRRRGRPGARVQ
jgi:hypothetical protein